MKFMHLNSQFQFTFLQKLFLGLKIVSIQKARAGIQEVHFLPFNPTDKRTALTYIDSEGKMHRVSKGAPEQVSQYALIADCCRISNSVLICYTLIVQILNLAYNRSEIEQRVHAVIDKFAERGLRSLGVAYQVM